MNERLVSDAIWVQRTKVHTCMKSTTLSSPLSRLAVILVAGNALGARLRRTRLREFVMVSAAMDTTLDRYQHYRGAQVQWRAAHTAVLVPEMERHAILKATTNVPHPRG